MGSERQFTTGALHIVKHPAPTLKKSVTVTPVAGSGR